MMLDKEFLKLHFFILLRFLLKFKSLIEILRRRAEVENMDGERFDVIIGDLADPIEGSPCYQLYTKYFYKLVLNLFISLF